MEFPTFSDTGIALPIRPEGIAFDLDGTLLDYDGHLSESVVRAIRMISRAGIKVFLITGRLETGAERYWRELGLDTPMATCNGAYIAFPGQEPFLHLRLGQEARDTILALEQKHGLYVNYYIDNHIYAMHDGAEREWYSRQFSPVERAVDASDITSRRLPTKCLCITAESEQDEIMAIMREALAGQADLTRSNTRFIEILPTGANKAVGLKALADWCDVPVDKFIAVGDALNDLPMLQEAGFAISFKSGDPQLQEHVDMLLPPLWEDGMDVLAKCILGMTSSGRFLTARTQRFFKK